MSWLLYQQNLQASAIVVSPAGIVAEAMIGQPATAQVATAVGPVAVDSGASTEFAAAQPFGIIATDAGASTEVVALSPSGAASLDGATGTAATSAMGAGADAAAAGSFAGSEIAQVASIVGTDAGNPTPSLATATAGVTYTDVVGVALGLAAATGGSPAADAGPETLTQVAAPTGVATLDLGAPTASFSGGATNASPSGIEADPSVGPATFVVGVTSAGTPASDTGPENFTATAQAVGIAPVIDIIATAARGATTTGAAALDAGTSSTVAALAPAGAGASLAGLEALQVVGALVTVQPIDDVGAATFAGPGADLTVSPAGIDRGLDVGASLAATASRAFAVPLEYTVGAATSALADAFATGGDGGITRRFPVRRTESFASPAPVRLWFSVGDPTTSSRRLPARKARPVDDALLAVLGADADRAATRKSHTFAAARGPAVQTAMAVHTPTIASSARAASTVSRISAARPDVHTTTATTERESLNRRELPEATASSDVVATPAPAARHAEPPRDATRIERLSDRRQDSARNDDRAKALAARTAHRRAA